MKTFRNDFGQARVTPTLDYHLVEPGGTILVKDDQWDHWKAGGWTPLDERPDLPPPATQDSAAVPAEPAPTAPTTKTAKTAAAAAEGAETA